MKKIQKSLAIKDLTDDAKLHEAKNWLRASRKHYNHNDSFWFFSRDYAQLITEIKSQLETGTYEYNPVRRISVNTNDTPVWIWDAKDAFVLKALSLILYEHILPFLSKNCLHIKGHGGIAKGVEIVLNVDFKKYPYVFKSDIKSYYESMNHTEIVRLFKKYVNCPFILDLIIKFLKRVEDIDGNYITNLKGISKGCPLSPLIGALYLSELDELMEHRDVIYCRFQDDWIVFAKTRWQLKKAIRLTNQLLNCLHVNKHPNKTYIGRYRDGLDFLGFHITVKGISGFSKSTKQNIITKISRLYEQKRNRELIYTYIDAVKIWVRGVLGRISQLRLDILNRTGWEQHLSYKEYDYAFRFFFT